MSAFTPFLDGNAFHPEAKKATSEAFDLAVKKLPNKRSPILEGVIARRIMNRAKLGEFDPQRLCSFALAGIGVMGNP
jgi:hypothetical protein